MPRLQLVAGIILLSAVLCLSGSCLENPFISINPIGDHEAGKTFTINGSTSLEAGKTLVIDIEPSRLHPAPSSEPPQNTTSLTGRTIRKITRAGTQRGHLSSIIRH
jgi:hypothetical protein